MRSDKLREAINSANSPDELLEKLKDINFNVTDTTIEGDSVLHVFAESNYISLYSAESYVSELLNAGADINAINRQDESCIRVFLKNKSDYATNCAQKLLEDPKLDASLISSDKGTLFEEIVKHAGCHEKELLDTLFKHHTFNPNQETTEHGCILHFILEKDLLYSTEYIESLTKRKNFDPNAKNSKGETAIARLIKSKRHNLIKYVELLSSHENFDVNAVDSDGCNFLQLLAIHAPYEAEDIAKIFTDKGIDLSHNNSSPKYSLKDDFDKFARGEIMGHHLQKRISTYKRANLGVNVEYGIAVSLMSIDYYRTRFIEMLTKAHDTDYAKVEAYVKQLTTTGSDRQKDALAETKKEMFKSKFKLHCFDEDLLTLEENFNRDQESCPGITDTTMFGHLFSLKGSIPFKAEPPSNNGLDLLENISVIKQQMASSVTLTGSFSDQTGPFMTHLMNAYVKHLEETGKYTEHLEAIKHVRNMTVKAMRYYFLQKDSHYDGLLSVEKDGIPALMLADSKEFGVEIFTGWSGHGIDLVVRGDEFHRNNGGGCSTDATTEIYTMGKPEKFTTEVITRLNKNSSSKENKTFVQRDLHDLLGLTLNDKLVSKFQTVGNCSFESKRIGLQSKYRLFLPESVADEIYQDTLTFFEDFYLQEYCERYHANPSLQQILIRLIEKRLLPEKKFDLAKKLLEKHFTTDASIAIMQVELLLARWEAQRKDQKTEQFDSDLTQIGVTLNPQFNTGVSVLSKFLNDEVVPADLEDLKSWPYEHQAYQGFTLLHIAVMNNNVALAQTIIDAFPNAIHMCNWHDDDALCMAKTPEMVAMLVKADANTGKTEYDNALDHAIKSDKLELVIAMLEAGVKPSNYSAYYAASRDSEILKAVMEAHPDSVTHKTHNHRTAVHAAALAGRTDNLRTLVYDGGLNPDDRDINGISPLQVALKSGKRDAVRALIESPCTLFKAPHRGDPVAEMTEDGEIKQMLRAKHQQKQADLEYFNQLNMDALGVINEDADNLIVALSCGDLRAVRGCLLKFPSINVVKWTAAYSTSPLEDAIQATSRKNGVDYQTNLGIVKLLLQTPAIDINARMTSTEPLMFMATSIDDLNVLELFLQDPKLDVNTQDNVMYTALHDAAERGHFNCAIRLLQDPRTDSRLLNKDGHTAAEVIKTYKLGARECKKLIEEHQEKMAEKEAGAKL